MCRILKLFQERKEKKEGRIKMNIFWYLNWYFILWRLFQIIKKCWNKTMYEWKTATYKNLLYLQIHFYCFANQSYEISSYQVIIEIREKKNLFSALHLLCCFRQITIHSLKKVAFLYWSIEISINHILNGKR